MERKMKRIMGCRPKGAEVACRISAGDERGCWKTPSPAQDVDWRERFMPGILLLAWAAVATQPPAPAEAAVGDVSFSTPARLLLREPSAVQPDPWSLSVVVQVEGAASVPATGWGMLVQITPQLGATGSIQFAPPAIVNDEPNLKAAAVDPFLDFDRDFGGKSYGELGGSSAELRAVSVYLEPQTPPPPLLDSNGNLTLPDGSGLVALPIQVSADAAGDFLLSFGTDPAVTGVTYATGRAPPNDVGIHPAAAHGDATLTVVLGLTGDMDCDDDVDFDDIDDFVLGLTNPLEYEATFGVPSSLKGDTDKDGDQDFDDIAGFVSILSAPLAGSDSSRALPEPTTLGLALVASLGLLQAVGRRYRVARPA